MPLLEVGAAARGQAIKWEEREAQHLQIKKEGLDDEAEEAGRASVVASLSDVVIKLEEREAQHLQIKKEGLDDEKRQKRQKRQYM